MSKLTAVRSVPLQCLFQHSCRCPLPSSGANSPGCFSHLGPLGRIPVDGSTPLKGRQPELVNCQATRSDARRTCSSRGTATLHFHRTIANPSPRSRRTGGTEKGFLNRRFKWLFAFFLSTQKEGAGSGGAEPPGFRIEKSKQTAPGTVI